MNMPTFLTKNHRLKLDHRNYNSHSSQDMIIRQQAQEMQR